MYDLSKHKKKIKGGNDGLKMLNHVLCFFYKCRYSNQGYKQGAVQWLVSDLVTFPYESAYIYARCLSAKKKSH